MPDPMPHSRPPPQPQSQRWSLRILAERLTLYLPVLLMGLLALGTWWLVRSAPRAPEPVVEQQPRHEPDYFMRQFSVRNFDASGHLSSELHGSELRHYPDTQELEIDQARLRSVTLEGVVTTAQAQRAISNADGSQVQLLGDARLVRQAHTPTADGGKALAQLEFQGEFLHAWLKEERIRSHLPVTLVQGGDVFTADSLDYDRSSQLLVLQGRVRGQFAASAQPQPGR